MKTINIGIFDNELGVFDKYNPRYVLNHPNTKEILTILSKKQPYYYSVSDIEKIFADKVAMNLLINISAVKIENNKLRLNFPFFNGKDVKRIKNIVKKELKNNFKTLLTNITSLYEDLQKIYPKIDYKLSMFHILCGKIFDGSFFEFLDKKSFLNNSYPKEGERNYMLIGYQDDIICNSFNDHLFCSINNVGNEKSFFTSFGNAMGSRLDFFRYFRLREIKKMTSKFKKLDFLLKDYSREEIIKNSLEIIKLAEAGRSLPDNNFTKALKLTRYISDDNKLLVPIFRDYNQKIALFSTKVEEKIGPSIIEGLTKIREVVMQSEIVCVKHQVDVNEISNELWHIYFGMLNQFLIDKKIVTRPKKYFKEGKYLKCVYMD